MGSLETTFKGLFLLYRYWKTFYPVPKVLHLPVLPDPDDAGGLHGRHRLLQQRCSSVSQSAFSKCLRCKSRNTRSAVYEKLQISQILRDKVQLETLRRWRIG